MKIRKIILTLIAVIILAFCADSIRIEASMYRNSKNRSLINWLQKRPKKCEEELNKNLVLRKKLYDYRGLFNRLIDKRYVYGRYKLPNGHLVTPSGKVKLEDKVKNLTALDQWCAGLDIPLLYINLPSKSENKYLAEYGVDTYAGENADALLAELSARGIDHLDMREYYSPEDLETLDIYFKTEHHWKISSALFSARVISQYINDHYHLGLNTSAITEDKIQTVFMPKSWAGEFGRKSSIAYSGLEDFEYITPLDPGSFRLVIPNREMDVTGGFSVMINDSVFQDPDPYKDSFYYAYLFGNDPLQIIDNLEERSGRILIVKDSFGQAVVPFLAMTADELIVWDVRDSETDLREYLKEHPVDLVVVMYTESFIQSRMFNFTGSQ